jgi:hypothetical protein
MVSQRTVVFFFSHSQLNNSYLISVCEKSQKIIGHKKFPCQFQVSLGMFDFAYKFFLAFILICLNYLMVEKIRGIRSIYPRNFFWLLGVLPYTAVLSRNSIFLQNGEKSKTSFLLIDFPGHSVKLSEYSGTLHVGYSCLCGACRKLSLTLHHLKH